VKGRKIKVMTKEMSKNYIKKNISKFGIVFVLFALIVLWSCLSDAFFTVNNLLLIIKQVSIYSILCIGMTLVLVTGGIDLSIGSIIALSAVFSAHYSSGNYIDTPLYIPIMISVAIGLICGLINGLGVAFAKIPAFIMTMCMMLAARGAAYVYTNAKAIFNLNEDFVNISNGFLGRTFGVDGGVKNYGIPYMVFYFIAALIIGIVILHFTTYGRRIYALGGNKSAARYSGINTKLLECSAYVISGLCAGICGFLMASRISSGNANSADGYEMTVISAAVIGGVSLSGGVGTMFGAMIGVLIVGVISNGMDILGINTYFQQILQAIIIFAAVFIDVRANGKKK
jgi:ribose/xylose/arabinose/galactoside ABC-type transport system permease subunit